MRQFTVNNTLSFGASECIALTNEEGGQDAEATTQATSGATTKSLDTLNQATASDLKI